MKILIVAQNFWPENFRINDLALGLKARGHDVFVLTGLPNYPQGKLFKGYRFIGPYFENWNGIEIHRVPLITRGKSKGMRLILNYLSFALSAALIAPFRFRKYKFDKIFVYQPSPVTLGLPAVLLKIIKGTPIYFWVTDLWPETLEATGVVKSKFILRQVETLVRFIYKHCRVILVSCRGFTSKIEPLRPSAPIIYWPQWSENFPNTTYSDVESLPSGFKLLFAGNIGASQAFDILLDAATKLVSLNSEIHWVILGDGRKKQWVEKEVVSRGLEKNFHLLGAKPVESMPRYFSLADGLLVSLKNEPLFSITVPSKIQSYLASGKPIIASLDGEGAELLGNSGAGLVSPAGDSQKLVENILRLYNMSKEDYIEMGAKAKQCFLENFEREKQFSKLEDIMSKYI